MPLYYFQCSGCQKSLKRLMTPEQYKALEPADSVPCKECGSQAHRTPSAATSQVNEVIDNGFMTRRLERIADAQRIYAERSMANRRAKGLDPEE
jgi:hypothetical protein